jgi:hypothetical protein
LAFVLAIEHKHGVNQVVDAELIFANQAACEVIATQAAQAGCGELGRNSHVEIVPQAQAKQFRVKPEQPCAGSCH